jgi:hypothetical protein
LLQATRCWWASCCKTGCALGTWTRLRQVTRWWWAICCETGCALRTWTRLPQATRWETGWGWQTGRGFPKSLPVPAWAQADNTQLSHNHQACACRRWFLFTGHWRISGGPTSPNTRRAGGVVRAHHRPHQASALTASHRRRSVASWPVATQASLSPPPSVYPLGSERTAWLAALPVRGMRLG